jgi:hypothetical protein
MKIRLKRKRFEDKENRIKKVYIMYSRRQGPSMKEDSTSQCSDLGSAPSVFDCFSNPL